MSRSDFSYDGTESPGDVFLFKEGKLAQENPTP